MEIAAPRGPVALSEVDLYDPESFRSECQHGTWATMRAEAPVLRQFAHNGTPFWSVTRYHDCERVIKEYETFDSEHGTILASVGVGDSAGGQTITLTDPPRHTEIRRPSMRSLGTGAVRRRAEQITAQVVDLVAPLREGGVHDIARLMRRLPMVAIGDLMGIPERHWDKIAFHTTASIAPQDPEFAASSSVEETLRRSHHELFACFMDALAERRRNPGDDLLSMLCDIPVDGRRMDERRVVLNCYSFLLGANSTTPHVATHALHALARDPSLWGRLKDDPDLVPRFVEEAARWITPTHHLVRRATSDTEICGTAISEGDWVCAWVASANRDEAVFDDPYAFRPERSPNPHLSFGGGPHYCIGAPSSRLALKVLFTELVEHVDALEVADDATHLYSNWINGITSLPVRVHPRSRAATAAGA